MDGILYQKKFRQYPELQRDYEANALRLSLISLEKSFPVSGIRGRVEESRSASRSRKRAERRIQEGQDPFHQKRQPTGELKGA